MKNTKSTAFISISENMMHDENQDTKQARLEEKFTDVNLAKTM